MAVVVRCPRCSRGYRIERTDEDRVFRCLRCRGEIPFDAAAENPEAAPTRGRTGPRRGRPRAAELTWTGVATRVGAILTGLAILAWLLTRGPSGPEDRLFAALDAELVAITEVVAAIETPRDSEAARPELNRRVAAFNRLLADPRPYGEPRDVVGPEVWERYGERLGGRLVHLRRQKSRVMGIQGAGRAVSATLRQLPQAESLLRRQLTEPREAPP